MSKVHQSVRKDKPFYDFLTETELEGRDLRNRIGPAPWLDLILKALKLLRMGTRPVELVMEHPELNDELPWLYEHRSRETISLPRSQPLTLEREKTVSRPVRTLNGVKEGNLGQDVQLIESLDTWVPEARGSSARVFSALMDSLAGQRSEYAIKLMRPDRVEYSLPLFREEAQILSMLRDVPGITPMVECGFINLENGVTLQGGWSSDTREWIKRQGNSLWPWRCSEFFSLTGRKCCPRVVALPGSGEKGS